jgi:hypothetical protein
MWFQNQLEHVFLPIFGYGVRHDNKLCMDCQLKYGKHPLTEIPLNKQDFEFKLDTSRFFLIINEDENGQIIQDDFERHFKIQCTRILSNHLTYIPSTQDFVNDELESLNKILKSQQNLFIYTNVKRDFSILETFHPNLNIWMLLDYPDSFQDWKSNTIKHSNIVVITLSGQGKLNPLSRSFKDIKRETLTSLLNRLEIELYPIKPFIFTSRNKNCYFGFGI